jgi:hypothetical protein
MNGDFILGRLSLVTNKRTSKQKNAHELGIRLPLARFR